MYTSNRITNTVKISSKVVRYKLLILDHCNLLKYTILYNRLFIISCLAFILLGTPERGNWVINKELIDRENYTAINVNLSIKYDGNGIQDIYQLIGNVEGQI